MSKVENSVEKSDDTAVTSQFVAFNIGKEVFAISVFRVQEVFNLPEITQVPNLPSYMKGVIDLRGVIVPLIDMRLKFALEEKDYDENSAVIIVEYGDKLYGLIVDIVLDVLDMTVEPVDLSQDRFLQVDSKVIKEMGRTKDGLVLVLNVDELLAVDVVELMA